MDQVEEPPARISIEELQEEAMLLFEAIWEDHSLEDAAALFLTTLGVTAVDTGTVGELIGAMNSTIGVAMEEIANRRRTLN